MPTYDFLNTKTGKEFSEFMSISEKETYLKHNSHIQQKVSSINIISGTGGIKNDGAERITIKDKLNAIQYADADRHGKKSIKEIKTRQVLKKHKIIK